MQRKTVWGMGRRVIIASLMIQISSFAIRADTVYNVDTTITSANPTGNPLQSDTVYGSITTDGTIGVIASGNVLSWSLDLIDGLNSANNVTLTPSNSTLVEDTGTALTATATELFFDYGGYGEFLIQGTAHGAYSGYSYFCFSTGVYACYAGETISPQYISADGVVATGSDAPVGQQPLGPPPSSAPDPTTCGLVMSGLVGLGTLKRKLLS